MAVFKRHREVEELKSFLGQGKVNIVAGLRRSGKTFLLDTVFKTSLIEEGLFKENDFGILYLDGSHRFIRTENDLDKALKKFKEDGKKIVIIDEVQSANGYVDSVKSFVRENKDITVYITGSNSKITSNDIINRFQEMANPLFINPLTYNEIIEEFPDYGIDYYLMYGGLPIVVNAEPEEKARELARINDEIICRDLMNNVQDKLVYLSSDHVKALIHLVASNLTAFSPSSVAKKFLTGLHRNHEDEILVAKEIRDIFNIFDNSFLLKHIDLDDYDEKTPLENIGLNKKYYFVDNGLRWINCKDISKATGNCLENAVFLKLDSAGIIPRGKLFLDDRKNVVGDIDFNFNIQGQNYLIQVTHTIKESCYKREVTNFIKCETQSIKQLVYLHNALGIEEEGIEYINAKDFLIGV